MRHGRQWKACTLLQLGLQLQEHVPYTVFRGMQTVHILYTNPYTLFEDFNELRYIYHLVI